MIEYKLRQYVFISLFVHIVIMFIPITIFNRNLNLVDKTINVLLIEKAPSSTSLSHIKTDIFANKFSSNTSTASKKISAGSNSRPTLISNIVKTEEKTSSSQSGGAIDERFVIRETPLQEKSEDKVAVLAGGYGIGGVGTDRRGIGDGAGFIGGNGGKGRGGHSVGGGAGYGSGIVDAGFGTPDGPKFQHREIPEYPYIARKLGKEGTVVLVVIIDEKGRLVKVDAIDATDQIFADAAIEAIKKSKFLPATQKGIPVPSRAILPIRFCLQ